MSSGDWHEANQRHLAAELARLRAVLAGEEAADPEPWSAQAPPALEVLATRLGLSGFERDVVLLCAGVELDAGFAEAVASLHGQPRPTFSLALAALPEPHWSALAPAAPLRHWRLVDLEQGPTLATSPLRIDERVLHYLAGVSYLDDRLVGLVEPAGGVDSLPRSHGEHARRVAVLLRTERAPVVQLCGPEQAGLRAVAAAACDELGAGLFVLRATDIPAASVERAAVARLWLREAALGSGVLYLDCDGAESHEERRLPLALAEDLSAPLVLGSRTPLGLRTRTPVRIDVERPGADERQREWADALGPLAAQLDGELDAAVAQFALPPAAVASAAAEVKADGATLWEACRARARPQLDDLARRVPSVATWDDLVLPEAELALLHEIVAQVRGRTRVHERWGFAARSSRGLGIGALFEGPSGTGKTMAAEVLAGELGLDLYRIDLSQVVSKYIGETEKNLRRVFDAAESGGAILLFDEAEALFGKRSEVKDSHDRYANIEIGYLLQRMEEYRGLAILTTNMKSALDGAFLRRLRFVVHFPFPGRDERAAIWRGVFPAATPLDGVDPEALAHLNMAGGNIRNVALGAAFLAADAGEPVRMTHLARAARSEYAKLERPLSEAELGAGA